MPPLTTYIWYIVKKSTKGHNSVKFGCSKNSFLNYHLHIKVVHCWKFKQNLPSGLRGVAFTRFRDVQTDGQVQRYMLTTLWGHKKIIVHCKCFIYVVLQNTVFYKPFILFLCSFKRKINMFLHLKKQHTSILSVLQYRNSMANHFFSTFTKMNTSD
jgi:hypothetical protein